MKFTSLLLAATAALMFPSVTSAQSPNKIGVLDFTISEMIDSSGVYRVFKSEMFDARGCTPDSRREFLTYLVKTYPQVRQVSMSISLDPLVDQDGIQGNNLRLECTVKFPAEYEHDVAWFSNNPGHLILTHWKPILKDPLAVHTASGQAPSKASAVNAARDLATSGYGNTIRKWGDSNCTQGTKLASQYGTARVTQWTCNIEFQTAASNPDGVAHNAAGKGDTEDGAIANAKSLATAGLLPSQIKSWDDPICSTQQEHASRYNSTQMKTVWVCAVGYTTYQ